MSGVDPAVVIEPNCLQQQSTNNHSMSDWPALLGGCGTCYYMSSQTACTLFDNPCCVGVVMSGLDPGVVCSSVASSCRLPLCVHGISLGCTGWSPAQPGQPTPDDLVPPHLPQSILEFANLFSQDPGFLIKPLPYYDNSRLSVGNGRTRDKVNDKEFHYANTQIPQDFNILIIFGFYFR